MVAGHTVLEGAVLTHQRKRERSPVQCSAARDGSLDPTKSPRSKRPRLPQINTTSDALKSGLDEEPNPASLSSLFSASETDSLYDGLDDLEEYVSPIFEDSVLSHRNAPPIPGLFFDPSVEIPKELADSVMDFCLKTYFSSGCSNQVMLFGRFLPLATPSSSHAMSGLPQVLHELLERLSGLLLYLPPDTFDLLFPTAPTMARQAIINLYRPGEGITPHVDLLGRYADGIIGVSFGSGCSMRFDKVVAPPDEESAPRRDIYLPERSVIVLSQEARYDWTHGIDKKTKDFVEHKKSAQGSEGEWIERGVRMSVTFRWLLPGADVVGDTSITSSTLASPTL